MDIPTTKYEVRNRRLVIADSPDARQGFLSQCIEAVLIARSSLQLSLDHPTVIDNVVGVHLGQVLMVGLHPDREALAGVAHGPWTVFERLRLADGRAQRRAAALHGATSALFLHGLHLLGRDGVPSAYQRLAFVSRACYRCAAGTLRASDPEGRAYETIADDFSDCSDILGQAAVELRFVDPLPSGLAN